MPEELGVGGLGNTTTSPKLNNPKFKAEQPSSQWFTSVNAKMKTHHRGKKQRLTQLIEGNEVEVWVQ